MPYSQNILHKVLRILTLTKFSSRESCTLKVSDLPTLTVLTWVSRFLYQSHGLTIFDIYLTVFYPTIILRILFFVLVSSSPVCPSRRVHYGEHEKRKREKVGNGVVKALAARIFLTLSTPNAVYLNWKWLWSA